MPIIFAICGTAITITALWVFQSFMTNTLSPMLRDRYSKPKLLAATNTELKKFHERIEYLEKIVLFETGSWDEIDGGKDEPNKSV